MMVPKTGKKPAITRIKSAAGAEGRKAAENVKAGISGRSARRRDHPAEPAAGRAKPEPTVAALHGEIRQLQGEVQRLKAELAQAAKLGRAAFGAVFPSRLARWLRFLRIGRGKSAWLRQQADLLRKSRLFDASFYLAQNPDVRQSGADPLTHYILIGGFDGRRPNQFFDSRWYLETYGDVAKEGINPLVHFIKFGLAEGRNASPQFDTRYYAERYKDVAASRLNPLAHFLRHGVKEGRMAVRGNPPAQPPRAPDKGAWLRLKPKRAAQPAEVDVIVPVYRGHDDTLACLHSVLSTPVKTFFETVVINDCSPDRALAQKLRHLAERGLITLVENERNLGFVQSVNRGMALHEGRDVVLLNSDTVVYNDWLDRLRRHGEQDRVGTVTPFSNNATICSYPRTLLNNNEQLEADYPALDLMAAAASPEVAIDIPTAVGFCMYIRRQCLDAVGPFDAATFGKGYGEENDFCRRAADLGWRNVLAADIFVRHTGEVSFAQDAAKGQSEAMTALIAKHPAYNEIVRTYIKKDPAAGARRRLDAARIRRQSGGAAILHVTHNWGGGIDRHVRDLIRAWREQGTGGVLMTAPERGKPAVDIHTPDDLDLPNLQGLRLDTGLKDIAEALAHAGISRIHVHSLAGWPAEATRWLRQLASMLDVPYDFTMHDYMAFCPRITFVQGEGRYCGEKGVASCRKCIAVHGTPFGRVNIGEWRRQFAHLLDGAEHVLAPSQDACKRTSGYLGGREVLYRPHPVEPADLGVLAVKWKPGQILRVMLVGGISEPKGSRLLLAMAEQAQRSNLPLSFCIVGHTDMDDAFSRQPNVSMTGRYSDDRLFELMAQQGAHVAFFASVWPETYSYVLTSLLEAGFPIAAFDIGAQAERLRALARDTSLFLDIASSRDAKAVNEALLGWAAKLPWPAPKAEIDRLRYQVKDYYDGRD